MHPDFGPSQWANHLRDSCRSFWEHQIKIFPSFMRCPRNTTELLLNRQRNNPRNINREQIKPLLLYGHVVKVPYELSNLLRYSWKMHRFRAEPLPRCPKKKAWPSNNPSRVWRSFHSLPVCISRSSRSHFVAATPIFCCPYILPRYSSRLVD